MKTTSLPERRQGFTLIELLAVILTLGVLIVCFAPALARSGDNERRMVCLNNLKHLGAALQMYAGDNSDYLPYPNWGTIYPGWLYAAAPPPVHSPSGYNGGLLYQYVRNSNYYLCPVDLESKYYAQRINWLSSYVMNGAVCSFGGITGSCKVTDVWNPGCYLLWNSDENHLMSGAPMGAFAFNDGSAYPSESAACLHSPAASELVTVAGDVRCISLQKFAAETNSATRSLAWWNPFAVSGH